MHTNYACVYEYIYAYIGHIHTYIHSDMHALHTYALTRVNAHQYYAGWSGGLLIQTIEQRQDREGADVQTGPT